MLEQCLQQGQTLGMGVDGVEEAVSLSQQAITPANMIGGRYLSG